MGKRIVGYADQDCVAPGESIRFMVSCDQPISNYKASIVRMIAGDVQPGGPGLKTAPITTDIDGTYPARNQEIFPGTYIRVDNVDNIGDLPELAIELTVYPTLLDGRKQSLLSNLDEAGCRGFDLFITEAGSLGFRFGSNGVLSRFSLGKPLAMRRWQVVGVSLNAKTGDLTLYQSTPVNGLDESDSEEMTVKLLASSVVASRNPLLIGAGHGKERPIDFFDGRIERPAIVGAALSQAEIGAVRQDHRATPHAAALIALWDFSLAISGERVQDVSGNNLHGQTVNLPIRAVRGSNWSGRHFDWTKAPMEYGAIHFLSDGLADCGWQADFTLTVPADLASGFYAASINAGEDRDFIPFFVRPPVGTASHKLAFLAPTMSYLAYTNWRLPFENAASELLANALPILGEHDLYLLEHPKLGSSLYDRHDDGTSVIYSSRYRPNLNMRPCHGWGEQYSADLYLTDWLDEKGIGFDVISDENLHHEGVALLANYACVMTGTHPEYCTVEMLDALQTYLRDGGRLMYMGGNGFVWRVALHPTKRGIIEMRRGEEDSSIGRQEPGEYYHGFDGTYGGLWSDMGRPPAKLVGVNFVSQGFDYSAYYRRCPDSFDPAVSFIFAGIGADELIGDFGLLGNGAAGLEVDRMNTDGGTPRHAFRLATSEGNHTATFAPARSDDPVVRSDLVYFTTPKGGAVFSVGSMAWAGSLSQGGYENNVSRITENVLRKFLDLA